MGDFVWQCPIDSMSRSETEYREWQLAGLSVLKALPGVIARLRRPWPLWCLPPSGAGTRRVYLMTGCNWEKQLSSTVDIKPAVCFRSPYCENFIHRFNSSGWPLIGFTDCLVACVYCLFRLLMCLLPACPLASLVTSVSAACVFVARWMSVTSVCLYSLVCVFHACVRVSCKYLYVPCLFVLRMCLDMYFISVYRCVSVVSFSAASVRELLRLSVKVWPYLYTITNTRSLHSKKKFFFVVFLFFGGLLYFL